MIVQLLKRIFSVNVISLIVAGVGLYFAIKSFYRGENGTVSICLDLSDGQKELENASALFVLSMGKGNEFDAETIQCYVPYFRNMTNRTVENIEIEGFVVDDCDIVVDFSNYDCWKVDKDVFSYHHNNLKAFGYIPNVFDTFHVKSIDNEFLSVYKISYDQIKDEQWFLYGAKFVNIYEIPINNKMDYCKYIEIRNDFLDDVKFDVQDLFDGTNANKLHNIYIVVGDTMVLAKKELIMDESYDITETTSLEEIGEITLLSK